MWRPTRLTEDVLDEEEEEEVIDKADFEEERLERRAHRD